MILGVDEAGRGPVIGPMVVAGVLMRERDLPRLDELDVRDSKRLTPQRREHLAREIMGIADHYMRVVSAEEIDARGEGKLNDLEVRAFGDVLRELSPRIAYADAADVNAERFARRLHQMYPCEIIAEHGADERYPIVSAASIIAKVHRDQFIKDIERDLGVPVGSGYPSDPITREFIYQWVGEHGELPPHCRRTWQTSRVILNSARQTTLF